MTKTNRTVSAKRRLDLSSAPNRRAKVRNPYLKAAKPAPTNPQGDAAAASTITPEAGIGRFFASKKERDAKPHAARMLVTPRENDVRHRGHDRGPNLADGRKREDDGDENSDLYYHSDEEARTNKIAKGEKPYEPGHIHSSLDYHHRGELPLDQSTLRAYRFVRDNFLVPRDIEADPKFGPHSGQSFEERVIRAYSLQLLKQKDPGQSKISLLVCSHCGEEGHIRDDCPGLV